MKEWLICDPSLYDAALLTFPLSIDAVRLVAEESMLKDVLDPPPTRYAFTMSNPPFFKDEKERLGNLGLSWSVRPVPSTFSTGTGRETVTEGGEVEFVRRMIEESLELRDRIR